MKKLDDVGANQRASFERFFDNSLVMFFIIDVDGKILKVNKWWEEVLGYRIEELEGESFLSLVHPDDLEMTRQQMLQESEGDGFFTFENRCRCRDGSWKSLVWSSVLDEIDGLIYGVARDVTSQNESETELREERDEADDHSAAKTEFLARMSHELRTPLNSVIGFSDLIVRKGNEMEPHKRDRFARNIRSSGHHLLAIVNDLLDLSKVENGKLELTYTRFSPTEAMEEAAGVIAPMAERKEVTVTTKAGGTTEEMEADRTKVVQVLYNLVTNAVKFTRTGGHVVVSVARDNDHDPPMVVFTVADDGIGIAANNLSFVFEAFEQVGDMYVRDQEGTGLGLSLSRSLAEVHGGTVEAASPGLGHGSTFTATFRAAPPPEEKTRVVHDGDQDDRPLVMVVEDSPQAAELIVEYLDIGGYRAAVVADGASAVVSARELKPAAITLDILVPGSDGWQILRDLRADPELAKIPVIVASVVDDKTTGFGLGAVGYLVKPVSDTDMLDALARFVPAGLRRTER